MTSLRSLLEGLEARWEGPSFDADLHGVACDSRRVRPGDLFVALRGHHVDGHRHAAEAVRAGAVALLVETPVGEKVPTAIVPSTEKILSTVAARFHGHPSRSMRVLGVTGTNGKTTITYMMETLLRGAGRRAGVLGTIEYRWPGHVENAVNTTPMAADVQRLLAGMKAAGVTDVAMEVSSHSLALGRVEDVAFAVGVFTNLTRDHLDFHKDMEGYFNAKARLFDLLVRREGPGDRRALINGDDPWAPRFLERAAVPRWTYALERPADIGAADLKLNAAGSQFELRTPAGAARVALHLVGRHNVYNALAAAGGGLALGLSLPDVVRGLESVVGVPGRLERVTEHDSGIPTPSRAGFEVFVDYAHTDDALKNVLQTLRPLTAGRLIVLFGCGGDRDKTKRPLMGEVAARLSDHVVVTSDNPRSEDPVQIAHEVEAGVRRVPGRAHDVIVDRGEAIARAVALAGPGDIVLLAGKGHETYQIFAGGPVPFDDRAEARRRLIERVSR